MTKLALSLFILSIVVLVLCALSTENYSTGDRIGIVTKFEKGGLFPNWKSWDGELHVLHSGATTSTENFNFSIDNDKPDNKLIKLIDSATNNSWEIKLTYHKVFLRNLFGNRGGSNYFIDKVKVLDKNTIAPTVKIDTIYIPKVKKIYKSIPVIVKSAPDTVYLNKKELKKHLKK